MTNSDHPIFLQSIQLIKAQLGVTGLDSLTQEVLERLIHSSGDFNIQRLFRFSPAACELGVSALRAGAPILTDTAMALAAVNSMASRTLETNVSSLLDWAPIESPQGSTRSAFGMKKAWLDLSSRFVRDLSPIVVIGSSPTALMALIDLVINDEAPPPSLIIGMPVGFIGVQESKTRLIMSGLPYLSIDGSRGGAGLAAASVNALLRASIQTIY